VGQGLALVEPKLPNGSFETFAKYMTMQAASKAGGGEPRRPLWNLGAWKASEGGERAGPSKTKIAFGSFETPMTMQLGRLKW